MSWRPPLRRLAQDLLPPAIVRAARRLGVGSFACSGDYASWADASRDSTGYDAPVILERVRDATLAVKRGEAAYERDGVRFDEIEYSWPLLGGLLWVASRNHGQLHVLDFGGALGSTYFQNRRFLSALEDVRWNVVEQPHFASCGNELIADERLRFYDDIDRCLHDDQPSVLLLSSVLQYLEDPHAFLRTLRGRFPFVLVDLTPVHAGASDRLTVQTVPNHIYPARYPCWLFSEGALLASLQLHGSLVERFVPSLGQELFAGRVRASYRGYLLEATS